MLNAIAELYRFSRMLLVLILSGDLLQYSGVRRVALMNFEWDELKNERNITKHGFDFNDACRVFAFPMVVDLDARSNYGEDRWVGTGMLDGRIVVVVYIEPDEETVRIISLRKALTHEKRRYEQYIKNRLE